MTSVAWQQGHVTSYSVCSFATCPSVRRVRSEVAGYEVRFCHDTRDSVPSIQDLTPSIMTDPHTRPSPRATIDVRVATYNIHRSRGLDRRIRPERIAAVLGDD